MRISIPLALLLLAHIVFLGGCQQSTAPTGPTAKEAIHADLDLAASLYRSRVIDVGGNRKITSADISQQSDAWFQKELQRIDLNRDGLLSKSELSYGRTRAPGAVIWSGMDENGDRSIGRAEFDASVQSDVTAILERYDGNGDGLVSRDEFAKFTQQVLTEHDTNKDGTLSPEELTGTTAPRSYAGAKGHEIAVMICGPRCVWDLPAGVYGNGGQPNSCTQNPQGANCPSTTHPGCTNGDVSSGNCHCAWPGDCEPFFD